MEKDQAQSLRERVERGKNGPKVYSISSGKGGVGKSNFTLNLGINLDQKDKNVVIIDADIGLANLEILLGIVSKHNLLDMVERNMKLEDILTDGPGSLKFISGGSGIIDLIDIDKTKLQNFISSIRSLENMADFILIDTGAGASDVVTSFASVADEVIVVTTCEPTAIADAYALIKVLVNKNINKKINVVVNRADTEKEARSVYNNLAQVAKRFLNTDIESLGYILVDDQVTKAVKVRKPFILNSPNSKASKSINDISLKILNQEKENEGNFEKFITKFKMLFK